MLTDVDSPRKQQRSLLSEMDYRFTKVLSLHLLLFCFPYRIICTAKLSITLIDPAAYLIYIF